MTLENLRREDPAVASAIDQELERQRDTIELIASENIVSPAVLEAVGTVLTNKYAEGYPRHRYYGGCEKVDIVEDRARDRACELFGCKHANVQPHCGANANLAAYAALIKPGDTVLGMSLDQGGHLTHGSPVNFSGQLYRFIPYGLDLETETIDYDELERLEARADRRRRLGVPAHDRLRAHGRDRPWRGCSLHGGHGPYRRARGHRRASLANAVRRCGDLDEPQDPARAPRRLHSHQRR